MIAASILVSLLIFQSPPACSDRAGCRAAALDAYARKDFEAFHDLAWLAYRKGSPDDPELMLMLARAQSLSGRPNDAFDVLQRLAKRGIKTDVATSEDFARVRAMEKWKQAYGEATPSSATPSSAAPTTFAPSNPPPSPSTPPAGTAPKTAPKPAAPPPAAAPRDPAPSAPGKSRSAPGVLSFTTLMKPTAMAYDAVSRRYLIADRSARRVSVLDEHSGQLSTFVGSQGSLGDIAGLAIDPQQGDLWVVSASGGDTALHRLQLISGRVLSTVKVTATARIVGLAWVRGAGLVAADASGQISRVSPGGHLQPIVRLEYDPAAIAADAAGRLYVSAGGSRLARFALDVRTGAREVLSLPEDRIVEGGIAISGERLHLLIARDGAYEIRTIPLKR